MFDTQRRSPVSFGADMAVAMPGTATIMADRPAPSGCPIPALDSTLFIGGEVVLKLAMVVGGVMGDVLVLLSLSRSKAEACAFGNDGLAEGGGRSVHIAVMRRKAIRETMRVG